MTAEPYTPDTPSLIRATHEQRCTLTLSDGTTTWTPTALSGSLTLAEDWSPFAQLTGTIGNVFTPAELAGLDPRSPLSLVLEAGYVHPDGTADLHPVFTGQLDGRDVKSAAGVIDVKASSAELLVQEAGWLAPATWKTFAGVTEAIEWLAGYALGTPVLASSSLGTGHRPDLVASVPLTPGQSLWEPIAAIALAADVRVYVDTAGTWTIAPKSTPAAEVAVYLSTGNGGIVETSTDTLTREGYYAAAVITFEWTDAGSVQRSITGIYGTAGAKTYTETRRSPVTQAQANAAAQATVRNLSTRGDSYECNGVAAYWLRPGHSVQITLANGTEARHIVKSVTFQFTAGTMTVTTREPTNEG